jgi:hypothetical protein
VATIEQNLALRETRDVVQEAVDGSGVQGGRE